MTKATNKRIKEQAEVVPNPKVEKVAKQIKELLEENGLALQPFLTSSAYGILPNVQLIEVPKQKDEK